MFPNNLNREPPPRVQIFRALALIVPVAVVLITAFLIIAPKVERSSSQGEFADLAAQVERAAPFLDVFDLYLQENAGGVEGNTYLGVYLMDESGVPQLSEEQAKQFFNALDILIRWAKDRDYGVIIKLFVPVDAKTTDGGVATVYWAEAEILCGRQSLAKSEASNVQGLMADACVVFPASGMINPAEDLNLIGR